MKLVYEEPKWYISGCRILDERGRFVGYLVDKELGKLMVDIYNEKMRGGQIEKQILNGASPMKLN